MSYQVGAVGFSSGATLVPLPAGTQRGDLIIVGMIGGFDGGAADMLDPRMEVIDSSEMFGRPTWVGTGEVEDDLGPVAVDLRGGSGAIAQFAAGVLLVFRAMVADPTRVVRHPPPPETHLTGPSTVPALPGNGTGAFGVLLTSGGFGGAYSSINWERTGMFRDVGGSGSYAVVSIAQAASTEVPEFPQPQTDDNNAWRVVVFGYNDTTETVVRQWPRDDGRGLSAAPRIHPVPRGPGLRVHGGIP